MKPLSEEDKLLIAAVNRKTWAGRQAGRRVQRGEIEQPRWAPPVCCCMCGKSTDVDQKDHEPDRDYFCSVQCMRASAEAIAASYKPTRKIKKAPTGCLTCGASTSTGSRGRPPRYCLEHKEG